jgi:SAM-dependent methyltransferase
VVVERANALIRGGLGSRVSNPVDWYWDARLGVRTFGYHPGIGDPDSARWHVVYAPAVYADIFAGLRAADVTADDVFVDLGSGLGRAVFAAAHMGVRQAVGVEYERALHEAAETNRAACRLDRSGLAFHNADARDYDLSAVTLLFLFHPFGAPILQAVIDNLRDAPRGRRLRVVYHNPVCEDVLRGCGWLREEARLPAKRRWFGRAGRFETAIWSEGR